jgi:nicotinamide mononucleotide transporter PnuC
MIEVMNSLATISGLIGALLNARKKKAGFIFWIISNLWMIVLNFHLKYYSLCFLFIIYTVLAIYGLYYWKTDKNDN